MGKSTVAFTASVLKEHMSLLLTSLVTVHLVWPEFSRAGKYSLSGWDTTVGKQ